MKALKTEPLSIAVAGGTTVSGVATLPPSATACVALAPGAGAGMNHSYMVGICAGLAARGIATLRYQFPYMEQGSRRPDPPALCHQTVRAAVAAACELMPERPLFAGGKSFGGRMTSQTQALAPLPSVKGLCFFGFPLHPPKKPAISRAQHLAAIKVPMLFMQGTRDELADLALLRGVVTQLTAAVTLDVIDHADHSFHVLVRSGTTDDEVRDVMLDAVAAWIDTLKT
jgi:predicted alpha/beta-hydrolase family hydrolase